MLKFNDVPGTNRVELTVDGRITQEDFDAVIDIMEQKIADYGHVAILEKIINIGAISPSVLWDDLKWAISHLKQVSRAAVVCDKVWVEKLVAVAQPVTSADVRHFALAEIEEARAWLARPA